MMEFLRRIIGIIVMIAGILGLLISLAGIIGVWTLKPVVHAAVTSTLNTIDASITTSKDAMEITSEALGATVLSIDALSDMLATTADSVEDTQPVFEDIHTLMGETLPDTLQAATDSMRTAEEASVVLESSIKSLDSFRAVLGSNPLLVGFINPSQEPYNPEKPLAESLGEMADNLEAMPATFVEMSDDLDTADDNLTSIQTNLITMSTSTSLISNSLSQYQVMVDQSQPSMDNLAALLTGVQANLGQILTYTAFGLSLFLLWLLVAQVVILTQGWDLYQGRASRMDSETIEAPTTPSISAG